MTTDTKAAETFYDKVVGWTSEPFDGLAHAVHAIQAERRRRRRRADGTASGDEHAALLGDVSGRAERSTRRSRRSSASAAASSPRSSTVPTIGRLQMLKDPQGAAFYVIQPEPRENPPDADPEVGEVSWIELMTTDAPAAMTFYQQLFGWQPSEAMDMGPDGHVPDVRPRQPDDRRHDEQAARARAGAAVLGITSACRTSTRLPTASRRTAAQSSTARWRFPAETGSSTRRDPQGAAFALHAKKA